MCGLRPTILRVASVPPIPGILRSISTTSGSISPARRTASSPVAASATSTASPLRSSRLATPSRKSGWSSARTTRVGFLDGSRSVMSTSVPHRDASEEVGAPFGPAVQMHRATQQFRTLAHAPESGADTCGSVGRQAPAIVCDSHEKPLALVLEPNHHSRSLSVLLDVDERLLHDTENGYLRGRWHGQLRRRGEFGLYAGFASEALAMLSDGRYKSQLIQHRRTKSVDQAPDVAGGLSDEF